jgi:hypothetical protein
MERPTQNAPEGFLHAWYSSKEMESTHRSATFYENEIGKKVYVTEVTSSATPMCRWDDLQYIGLVVCGTWGESIDLHL